MVLHSEIDSAGYLPAQEVIGGIVGHTGLAQDLAKSIRVGLAEARINGGLDPMVIEHFYAARDAVTLDVDTHPTGTLLKSLLSEESERTNAEVVKCLRFIYYHMVNKFKGNLAEFLAIQLCTELVQEWKRAGFLPAETYYVWGNDIKEQKTSDLNKRGRQAWHKGADGLFIVEEPRTGHSLRAREALRSLMICGVVEVKSYRLSSQHVKKQMDKHLARFEGGLKIGDREWPTRPPLFRKVGCSSPYLGASVTESPSPEVFRLLAVPRRINDPPVPAWQEVSQNTFLIILPYTSDFLTAAAYRMTEWFLGYLGSRVFQGSANPWPQFTPEEAGFNAAKEALYHIHKRDLSERAMRIASRLFNVYGFGYEDAKRHKEMIWSVRGKLISDLKGPKPSMDVPVGMDLDEVVECAWSFYNRCYMKEALSHINIAISMSPDVSMIRRLKWLRGMIHYARAEFDQAAQEFPSPLEHQDEWWARDKLTLAKIFARLGRVEEAIREINEVSKAKLPYRVLSISIPVCEAMVSIGQGKTNEARQSLGFAVSNLKVIRAEAEKRESEGLGTPVYFNPSAIQIAVIDMATVFVSLQDCDTAMEILSCVENVFPPSLMLMETDPALETLRSDKQQGPRFKEWLEERHKDNKL